MKNVKLLFSAVVSLFLFFCLGCNSLKTAEDFALIRDGAVRSSITVKEDAPRPVHHAAAELSHFLEKITDGARIPVSSEPDAALYNVFIGTVADQQLVRRSGLDAAAIQVDGFGISAKNDGLYVIGGSPLGALYGAYDILKKYAGIRWLTPRPDGEYYTIRKTILIPAHSIIRNPRLSIRRNSGATMEWAARNYLQPYGGMAVYRTEEGAAKAENHAYQSSYTGGHIMTWLLADGNWGNSKAGKAILEDMFAKHPEYFPLINGKRTMMGDANSPNPCVSNPAVLDIMAATLTRISLLPNANSDYITLGNNDTTVWCECEDCQKLDNPATKGTKGQRSDRYWYAVNEIAKRVWAKNPAAKIRGWAYQDFWYPPTKVRIDPRIAVIISYNNQCWRHAITDPKCPVNAEMHKIYSAWKKLGLPLINNRDEITADGSAGSLYLPCERVLYQNCLDYPALGCNGTRFCTTDPLRETLSWTKNRPWFYGKNYMWDAIWQTCYMTAEFMFDIEQDFDAMYEEINSLYYGKGWDGGMREYNALRTKAFLETPGCIGWGLGAPLGRCLDQAGVEQKLKDLLEMALKAAAKDPDPRALQHVQRDRDMFYMAWVEARKHYLENFKELSVYQKSAPIVIDGDLSEAPWKEADVMNTFKLANWQQRADSDNLAAEQTYVRVVYDNDNLYIAVECMEPSVALLEHSMSERDKWPQGNKLELFYNYPDMAEKYYQICVNTGGAFYDALVYTPTNIDRAYDSQAEHAIKILKDRWILEIRLPCSVIGMKCLEGATWKLNVARGRVLSDGTKEQSSCSNGNFHGAANFVNMKFVSARGVGSRDRSAWKNSSFNILTSNTIKAGRKAGEIAWPSWTGDIPAGWSAPEGKTSGSVKLHANSADDYYLEWTGGILAQWYKAPPSGKLRLQFRVAGKGELAVWSMTEKDSGRVNNRTQTFSSDSDEWQTFSYELVYDEGNQVLFRLYHRKGTLRIDDVLAVPGI